LSVLHRFVGTEPDGELCARTDADLGVDVVEVTCNSPFAEEQRGGDLPIRSALGDE
jgi:hypothetical protein